MNKKNHTNNMYVDFLVEVSNNDKFEIIKRLKYDDIILIKRLGVRHICKIGDKLVFYNKDDSNIKAKYRVKNIIKLNSLTNREDINRFLKKYFSENTENENLILLTKLNLIDIFYKKQDIAIDGNPDIEVFKKVISGELSRFPYGFWQEEVGYNGSERARDIVKYLFDEILKWGSYEIYKNVNYKVFKEYKLTAMLSRIYDNNPVKAIVDAYNGRLKPWLFKNKNITYYWDKNKNGEIHAKEAIKWLLERLKEDGWNVNKNNLLGYNWEDMLKKYNLKGILTTTCNDDIGRFFKLAFDKEYSQQEIDAYKYKFNRKTRDVKIHI